MIRTFNHRLAQQGRSINRLPNVPRTLLVHTLKGTRLMALLGIALAIIVPDPAAKAVCLQTVAPSGVMLGFLSGVFACLQVYPRSRFSQIVRVILMAWMVLLTILSCGMLGGMIGVMAGKRCY